MTDHSDLVAEMSMLEQMGTQERQKLAKKRRLQQLKKWSQREKEWLAKEKEMNRRIASKISEENNGLNLKNFTQFSLNERSPQKDQLKSHITTSNRLRSTGAANDQNHLKSYSINNNNNHINGKDLSKSRSLSLNGLDKKSLSSIHGKVHFDAGIMLLEAAARNDYEEVKRLLMLGVSPNSTNHDGLSALHQCCIEASEPMIDLLLEYGAHVDARDTEHWTPLHAACTCGHLSLVQVLVENGADLLAVNGDGNMPFDLCEDEQTLDYLESQMVAKGITQNMIDLARASTEMQMISEIKDQLDRGVDINSISNENGVTPVHVAAANGYLSALEFLIKRGASVNVCDSDLWQPLHGAACWGNEQHVKTVEFLVESGADLNAKTINDETIFDLCDNPQLLERLNEIKDEIESKQAASDADRLKRTQSRTNSRIHSIRRTSVRDKNQISRREAREEALLRTESNQHGDHGSKADEINGIARDSKIPDDNHQSNTDTKDHPNVSSSKTSVEDELKRSKLEEKGSNKSSKEVSVHQNGCGHMKYSAGKANGSSHNSEQSSETTSLRSAQSKPSLEPKLAVHQPTEFTNGYHEVGDIQSIRLDSMKRAQDIATHVDESRPNIIKEKLTLNANDKTVKKNMTSTVMVNLKQVNYTLSNLKKQRSDSRLRGSSIGNVQAKALSDGVLSTHLDVLLDPGAEDDLDEMDNGSKGDPSLSPRNRSKSISPDPSIRKFRGEASEAFGDLGRVRRRNCCIII